jgi:6-phospho-beta-glucosidase
MGFDWVRQVGAIPNEYMYYYYFTREAVERIKRSKLTRGQLLVDEQRDFYDAAGQDPARAFEAWRAATDQRESTYMAEARAPGHEDDRLAEDLEGGYHKVALQIMSSLANGTPTRLILDVANSRAGGPVIAGLPAECVVEVPCVVDGSGIRPAAVAPVKGEMLGLLQEAKAVEQLTIAAAVEGSAALAWKAMALHPLVDSARVAKRLLDRYQRAHPELAYLK